MRSFHRRDTSLHLASNPDVTRYCLKDRATTTELKSSIRLEENVTIEYMQDAM